MRKFTTKLVSLIAAGAMLFGMAAAGTVTLDDPDSKQWNSCFKNGDYITGASLTKDTPLDVTINFEWSEKGTKASFCAVKPAFANGWESFYVHDKSYMTGIPVKVDMNDDGQAVDADGNAITDAAIQDEDGFIQIYNTEVTSVKFTLSADCVNDIIDTSAYGEGGQDSEDGSKWDGILFQVGNNGMTIKSIEFSQDAQLNSKFVPGDSGSSDSGSSDSGSSDSGSSDSGSSDSGSTDTKTTGTDTKTTTTTDTKKTDTATKTGDATSVAVLAAVALLAMGGVVYTSKKKEA